MVGHTMVHLATRGKKERAFEPLCGVAILWDSVNQRALALDDRSLLSARLIFEGILRVVYTSTEYSRYEGIV